MNRRSRRSCCMPCLSSVTARTRGTLIATVLIMACAQRSNVRPTTHRIGVATSSVDGARIKYEISGDGEPTLVLIHGWACNRTFWRRQVDHFSSGHRVITIDLAGHGESGLGDRVWTIRNFAADVATVVRQSNSKSAVLIGHSLGGPIAVEAALLLPRQTAAVVGVDTFFDLWDSPSFTGLLHQLRTDWPTASKRFAQSMFNPRSDSALVSSVTKAMSSASPGMATDALGDLPVWWRTRFDSVMRALQKPVGVIQASANGHQRLETHRHSLARLDTAVVAGLGHFIMLADPDRFNTSLDSQLRRLLSPSKP